MYRMMGLLLLIIPLLVLPSFAKATEDPDFSGILKSRKVIGVIYFKKHSNSSVLSKSQQVEINRIATLVSAQSSPDKIVRVEGFITKNGLHPETLNDSFSIAKSVWYYLQKIDSFNSSNLYLTGFSTTQSISRLQGARVEIAIYENPFNEKTESYISN